MKKALLLIILVLCLCGCGKELYTIKIDEVEDVSTHSKTVKGRFTFNKEPEKDLFTLNCYTKNGESTGISTPYTKDNIVVGQEYVFNFSSFSDEDVSYCKFE